MQALRLHRAVVQMGSFAAASQNLGCILVSAWLESVQLNTLASKHLEHALCQEADAACWGRPMGPPRSSASVDASTVDGLVSCIYM